MIDQVSQPYKTTDKIRVSLILISMFFDDRNTKDSEMQNAR
jgi:hypothetical protein